MTTLRITIERIEDGEPVTECRKSACRMCADARVTATVTSKVDVSVGSDDSLARAVAYESERATERLLRAMRAL